MTTDSDISVQFVRNATVLATIDETTFLVDPMFTPEGEMPTVTDNPAVPEFLTTANQRRNPLVPLQTSTSPTTQWLSPIDTPITSTRRRERNLTRMSPLLSA